MKKHEKQFMDENSDRDVPLSLNPMSTWGSNFNIDMLPRNVMTRYVNMLKKVKFWLFLILIFILLIIVGMTIKFIFFTEYENYIFDDGTEMVCVFNPENGEMKQNGK